MFLSEMTNLQTLTPQWKIYGDNPSIQQSFDIAVILPTVGRSSLLKAVSSVYAQSSSFRIQLLIGVDAPLGDFEQLDWLLDACPSHITPCLFYPGYSTSVRHGGLHPSRDGGAMRTTLSYLANARYLAYLDDDNWWEADHLASLMIAIDGNNWAYSLRRFIHPKSLHSITIDFWESVGVKRGYFSETFGGFVDPNCLLIDKLSCEPVLRWWSIPLPNDSNAMSADRHVFHWLSQKSIPGETGQATVNYVIQENDVIHPIRLNLIGKKQYDEAGNKKRKIDPKLSIVTTCKGRLEFLKQSLPLFTRYQDDVDIILVDYGCPQKTSEWVRENYPNVKIVQVTDDVGFNSSRAKNLGASNANTPWLLFVDADILVNEGLLDWIKNLSNPRDFFIAPGEGSNTIGFGSGVTGSFFCSAYLFNLVGGFDEAFIGWGAEDEDLYRSFLKQGARKLNYPDSLFSDIKHPDQLRFFYHPETNVSKQMTVNKLYRFAKYDLMKLLERNLTLQERLKIRQLSLDTVNNCLKSGNFDPELTLDISEHYSDIIQLVDTWEVLTKISYQFSERHPNKMPLANNGEMK